VRSFANRTTRVVVAGIALAGAARASEVLVTSNISTSTTWTSDNVYNLQNQVYVLPGATLTIEAGTIVASEIVGLPGQGGSLAVCRGAQIFVQGTADRPVIMTSKNDVATWTGGDPRTGTWRQAANEWGNLAIMGSGYISENAVAGNVPTPDAGNEADLEGLTNGPATDRYGGGDDDDDSGSITYLSLRYTGKVIGLGNELNGLALGGVGRDTDIHHIDIMNGVDDGIEIWGGTVNVKYFNIWNVGDDSFDIDQGWRGKAQFGLIVQGYSLDAAQGSGVGDNCFETDGAENSDWQPVTTTTIYNVTAIGQPAPGAGDHGTAWRDNARVQYRNCIFMDLGDRLVSFDNQDGDGGSGYGHNSTLSWANTWTTAYNAVPAHANDPSNPAAFYQAQSSGMLAEITDSVVFRNASSSAYTEANNRGVFAPANNNVLIPGSDPADAPIVSIARGSPVVKGGVHTMLPVVALDPRPANEALTSVAAAPNDGFFTPAQYRGAFDPADNLTWLCGWTASEAYGFTSYTGAVDVCDPAAPDVTDACTPDVSWVGVPDTAQCNVAGASDFVVTFDGMAENKSCSVVVGKGAPVTVVWSAQSSRCFPSPYSRTGQQDTGDVNGATACGGQVSLDVEVYLQGGNPLLTPAAAGDDYVVQTWYRDPASSKTTQMSDAVHFIVCP
jgi:hypothetical protein